MNRGVVVGLSVILLGMYDLAGTVGAQGTPPAAKQLLTQAQLAMQAAGSAHLTVTGNGSLGGANSGTIALTAGGDLAWKTPNMGNISGTATYTPGSMPAGVTAPFQLIVVGQRVAVQLGPGGWTCSTATKMAKQLSLASLLKTKGTRIKVKQSGTVGPDTVGGVAVWHVHEVVAPATKKGQKAQPVTVDLYIGQADSLVRRAQVTSSQTASGTAATVTATVDLSNFGKTVQAQLPAVCTSPATRRLPITAGRFATELLALLP